jgi:hypothetical protein
MWQIGMLSVVMQSHFVFSSVGLDGRDLVTKLTIFTSLYARYETSSLTQINRVLRMRTTFKSDDLQTALSLLVGSNSTK